MKIDRKKTRMEKYLPHNFLAEKMLLSCLLIDFHAIEKVAILLPIEAFYFRNHKNIYSAIIIMHEKELSIDIITLADFLQENGLLERIGGVAVLLDLINQIPNLTYLEEYVRLIKEKFVRRSLIKLGYELINSSYIANISLENIFNSLESELSDLTNEVTESKTPSSGEILIDIFAEIKGKFLNPGLPGIKSGFNDLDELTQGFQKSDLIIIAGRPSMGKTAFSLSIALNVIRDSRLPVLFFSLEMSTKQIMYRILTMETNVSQARLKSGKLYQNDWIKLNKIMKIISKLPLFMDDSPNLSVDAIREKIKTIILEQHKLGVVMIDYLQLMQNTKSSTISRVEEISKITRQLKGIAREFNIPIIALSQLNRSIESRINGKPILSDLRESGSIEQDADVVLMLSKTRPKTKFNKDLKDPGEAESVELILAKHRNGPTGTVSLNFFRKQTRFYDE